MIAVTEALDAVGILARILTDHGPLHEDDIARLLQDNGVVDPDVVIADALDGMSCPAEQLLDNHLGMAADTADRAGIHPPARRGREGSRRSPRSATTRSTSSSPMVRSGRAGRVR